MVNTTRNIQAGDVVEIVGAEMWAGCLMEVEEVRTWGVKGTVKGYNGAEYPLRVALEEIATIWKRTGGH